MTGHFTASPHERSTWARWARTATATHVLRGAQSDLLLPDAAQRMTESGPRPHISTFPDCGHAPSLSRPEDIAQLRDILANLRP